MMKKSLDQIFVLTKATVVVVFFVVVCVSSVAASAQGVVREVAPPAGEGSGQSFLSVGRGGRVYLSWIDRLAEKRVALRFAVREGAGWSAPQTVAEGENWFVNWADFPSVVGLADGSLAAHWLVRNGPGTYAFDVRLARSFDGGRTWGEAVTPHRDGTQTEHGFVSMFAAAGEKLGAVWLDGREMKPAGSAGGHAHGEMTLRHATLARDGGLADEEVLDARVCECCQTSAALTSEGVVVVYRDRLEGETEGHLDCAARARRRVDEAADGSRGRLEDRRVPGQRPFGRGQRAARRRRVVHDGGRAPERAARLLDGRGRVVRRRVGGRRRRPRRARRSLDARRRQRARRLGREDEGGGGAARAARVAVGQARRLRNNRARRRGASEQLPADGARAE